MGALNAAKIRATKNGAGFSLAAARATGDLKTPAILAKGNDPDHLFCGLAFIGSCAYGTFNADFPQGERCVNFAGGGGVAV